jgi:uncharacterized membrane protein
LKNVKYLEEEQLLRNNKQIVDDRIKRTKGKKISNKEDGQISDPLNILKVRLAKGEITKNEYNELYNAISS